MIQGQNVQFSGFISTFTADIVNGQVNRGKKKKNSWRTKTNLPTLHTWKPENKFTSAGSLSSLRKEANTKQVQIFISKSGLWLVWLCLTAMLSSLPWINNCSLCNYEKKFRWISALKISGKLYVTRKIPKPTTSTSLQWEEWKNSQKYFFILG